jgi:hypothetical protein
MRKISRRSRNCLVTLAGLRKRSQDGESGKRNGRERKIKRDKGQKGVYREGSKPVNISYDGDRSSDMNDITLSHQDFFNLLTYRFEDFFA